MLLATEIAPAAMPMPTCDDNLSACAHQAILESQNGQANLKCIDIIDNYVYLKMTSLSKRIDSDKWKPEIAPFSLVIYLWSCILCITITGLMNEKQNKIFLWYHFSVEIDILSSDAEIDCSFQG